DKYFLEITRLLDKRSTCLRRQVGALIVKDKRILATGYNGAPTKIVHCNKAGCLREKLKVPAGERHELCRGLHAEQNVLIQAARYGTDVSGGVLYCTNHPCIICTKMLINAGIKKVVVEQGYPDQMSKQFLKQAKIEVKRIKFAKKRELD
ncbi:MAG: cytidine/deoxycytidylate deaminase family protein, partial [Candidatus Omnitrophota bacterium]|nr:cytidine/deoxycytidylate deaminase family protein [Candidatus Omnitrophota bacterium]